MLYPIELGVHEFLAVRRDSGRNRERPQQSRFERYLRIPAAFEGASGVRARNKRNTGEPVLPDFPRFRQTLSGERWASVARRFILEF